jgi:hypothetical protein
MNLCCLSRGLASRLGVFFFWLFVERACGEEEEWV